MMLSINIWPGVNRKIHGHLIVSNNVSSSSCVFQVWRMFSSVLRTRQSQQETGFSSSVCPGTAHLLQASPGSETGRWSPEGDTSRWDWDTSRWCNLRLMHLNFPVGERFYSTFSLDAAFCYRMLCFDVQGEYGGGNQRKTSGTLHLFNVTVEDDGMYVCVTHNPSLNISKKSRPAKLTVQGENMSLFLSHVLCTVFCRVKQQK